MTLRPESSNPVIVVRPGEAGTAASSISRTPRSAESRWDAGIDGPHTDHLAQLIRRQRRRQRLRHGLFAAATWRLPRGARRTGRPVREMPPEQLWAWLNDGQTRRLLADPDRVDPTPEVLTLPRQARPIDEPSVRWTPDRAGDWSGDWTGEWKWLSSADQPDVSGRGRRS